VFTKITSKTLKLSIKWPQNYCEQEQNDRNEIHLNETKLTETKRNGIIQNEIKPILTKSFLGEIQSKN
jgi:hypothetical protein